MLQSLHAQGKSQKIAILLELPHNINLDAAGVLRFGGSSAKGPGKRLVLIPEKLGLADVPVVEKIRAIITRWGLGVIKIGNHLHLPRFGVESHSGEVIRRLEERFCNVGARVIVE